MSKFRAMAEEIGRLEREVADLERRVGKGPVPVRPMSDDPVADLRERLAALRAFVQGDRVN